MTEPQLLPADIRAAVREMHSFVDCSEADLVRIYRLALDHARRRVQEDIPTEKVMTREVVTVRADALPEEAEALLLAHQITGLPVLDDAGRVVGVVTEKDFLYRLEDPELFTLRDRLKHFLLRDSREVERKIHARSVAEIMSSPAITVEPAAPLKQVANLMVERDINRVPVVDGNGRLQGIVSRADLFRVLHKQAHGERDAS